MCINLTIYSNRHYFTHLDYDRNIFSNLAQEKKLKHSHPHQYDKESINKFIYQKLAFIAQYNNVVKHSLQLRNSIESNLEGGAIQIFKQEMNTAYFTLPMESKYQRSKSLSLPSFSNKQKF